MNVEPMPMRMASAVVALWEQVGLTRPWNDPRDDLQRAMRGPDSTVLVGMARGALVATAMAGHDGHRGWVYYLAVIPEARGQGHGHKMMRACEAWLTVRAIPKLNVMIRVDNANANGFYSALGYRTDDIVVMSRRLDK